MKRLTLVILLLIICTLKLHSDEQFEGYVKYDIYYNDNTMDIYSYAKGKLNKFRLTIPVAGYFEVLIREDKVPYILFKDQKIAMKITIPDIDLSKENSTNDNISVNTGKHKIIAGHQCEQLIYKDDSSKVIEVWFATDFGIRNNLNAYELIKILKNTNAMSELVKGGNIGNSLASTGIMEVIAKEFRMTAIEVNQKKLKDSEFEIPSDYKIKEMPNFPMK